MGELCDWMKFWIDWCGIMYVSLSRIENKVECWMVLSFYEFLLYLDVVLLFDLFFCSLYSF